MRILDSHFHYYPREIFEALCKRTGFPRAERDDKGGYRYFRHEGAPPTLKPWKEWFDLDDQLARMDATGHQIDVVSSLGPYSVHFSELPPEEGREAATIWNEAMAKAQREHPGRVWGTAAIPLVDTQIAIDVLDDAVNRLGLVGANLPGSVGPDQRIDADRLQPFYARAAEVKAPLFLHPTDAVFPEMLTGYDGALYLTMGRVIEVSVAATRLILSGTLERHPDLTIVMSHTGGMLPYQAGRLDKNGKAAKLGQKPSTYLKRMYTDTTSPHAMGIKFAIDYFGLDHVMFGDDYPCWDPDEALRCCDEIGLSDAERQALFNDNAHKLFDLRVPAGSTP
jgi:aminocarboxymuconate-semialdehyde decarboxylase